MTEHYRVDWLGSTQDQPGTADFDSEAEALEHERQLTLRGTRAVVFVMGNDEGDA